MRSLILALALLAPVPALALSCVMPSVARTYAEVDAAPQSYLVVEGRLTLDDRLVPRSRAGDVEPPGLTKVPATLTGRSMTRRGFTVPFEQRITLEIACLGPWCGSAANGTEVLAFVRREGGAYALQVDPCGGHVFPNERPQRQDVLRCYRSGNCR